MYLCNILIFSSFILCPILLIAGIKFTENYFSDNENSEKYNKNDLIDW